MARKAVQTANESHRGSKWRIGVVEVVSKADRYLEASVRQNTSKSYAAALSHFEVTWVDTCLQPLSQWCGTSPSTLTS